MQTLEILNQCSLTDAQRGEIGAFYLDSLVKKLMRCWEIKERLSSEFETMRASYKPPGRGAASVELPQIPRLEEEAHNFLYEAKNYLRDLLQVFNLLYGTNCKEASEWTRARKGRQSVMDFAEKTFTGNRVNTAFFRQLPACIEPLVDMRNAVEHPKGWSGELKISNFVFDAQGKLVDPFRKREKDGKVQYGRYPSSSTSR